MSHFRFVRPRCVRVAHAASLVAVLMFGCGTSEKTSRSTHPADPTQPTDAATYQKDIRPILEANCTGCHTSGGIAPFTLESWGDVEERGGALVTAVQDQIMPPWPVDDACHPLRDSRALSPEQRELFQRWEDYGYLEGDPADYVPPATTHVEIGDPTILMDAGVAYSTPKDVSDNYHCFLLNGSLDRDTYVTAVDILPGRRELVHHVQIHTIPGSAVAQAEAADAATPEAGYPCFGGSGVPGSFNMFSYRPGTTTAVFQPGDAVLLEAGTRIVIQVHYNTQHLASDEEPQPDLTQAAFWTLPEGELPDRIVRRTGITALNISVPPGDAHWVTEQTWPMSLMSFVGVGFLEGEMVGQTPHAHQIASRLAVTRKDSAGNESCMIDVPRWNFEWQMDYFYASEAAVPFGASDSLTVRCEYDNSPAHQPYLGNERIQPRQVTWGEGSFDEMCLNYVWLRYDRQKYLQALGR